MHKSPSRFQEVGRILRENEQLHRHVGCLEGQNHRVSEELRTTVLQLEWIATIAREDRLLLRRDLHRVLFSQLYARAAEQPRLLAVIKEWDQNFLSDNRIARDGHSRKIIYRVRQLAREILRDLEAELSLVTNEGREMLL